MMIGLVNSGTLVADKFVPLEEYKVSGDMYLKDNFDYLNYSLGRNDGTDVTTVAFIVDPHTSVGTSVRFNPYKTNETFANNQNPINRLDRAMVVLHKLSANRKIDALILGGDYLGNSQNTPKEDAVGKKDNKFGYGGFKGLNTCVSRLQDDMPVIICRGNHDGNSMNSYVNTVNASDFSKYVHGEEGLVDGTTHIRKASKVVYGDENRLYGYFDDEKNKLRILFLNTSDVDLSQINEYTSNPTTLLSNLKHDYNLQYKWFIGQKQAEFIVKALTFPADKTGWGVVVFSHHQFLKDGEALGSGTSRFFNELFIRFRHRQVFKKTASVSSDPQFKQFNLSLDVDFSKVNAGGANVFLFVHGHYHTSMTDMRKYLFGADNSIGYTSSGGWSGYLATLVTSSFGSTGGSTWDGRRYEHSAYNVVGRDEADFDIFQFKRDGSKLLVYANRYGAGLSATHVVDEMGEITTLSKDLHIALMDETSTPLTGFGDKVCVKYNGAKLSFKVFNTLPTASSSYVNQDYLQVTSDDSYIFTRCIKYTQNNQTKYGWFGKTANTSKITWPKGHFYFYNIPVDVPFSLEIDGNGVYKDKAIKFNDVSKVIGIYNVVMERV
ncbi:MAG: metallophosphoesterase [Paludibacteraceae bacterium]|nr:metallophosphoesterase [Paludibacteraceae bacterium]